MTDFWYAFTLTCFAGLSSCIGFLAVVAKIKNIDRLIAAALGFSAGAMLSVSLCDLLPEAMEYLSGSFEKTASTFICVAFMIIGFALAMGIDRLVPHDIAVAPDSKSKNRNHNLLRVGVVSAYALALHNFPEGMATLLAGVNDRTLGLTVALGIALHNIPEGLSIALPIYLGTGSRKKSFLYVIIAALAEPLGAVLAYLIFKSILTSAVLGGMFAFVAGIMLYITFEELLPTSRKYGYNNATLFSTMTGIIMILVSHIF